MKTETFHIDGHRVTAQIDRTGDIHFDDLPDGLDEGDAREAVRRRLTEDDPGPAPAEWAVEAQDRSMGW